jgi:PAS domain S-box-containing protein
MNYNQIAILLLQGTLVAFVILLLFRLRKRLGIGVLFACLGLLQFIQVFLSSTVYVSITDSLLISPGFSIFFTATLFILLIIYIKEDASETRKIIYALIIVNIVTAILLQTFELYFKEVSINISSNLFKNSTKVLIVGTIALFLDSLLIIVLFEFISRHIRFLFFRILITMLIVVSFDSIFFSIIAFWKFDSFYSILISGLISKGFFTVFYSIIFYIYLKYFDSVDRESTVFKVKDVFQYLSFKQKFESVSDEIRKVEEMYRLLADHSNDLICLHEPDSTFKYISPSVKNILGYEQSEFLGKQVFDMLHNDDIEPLQDAIEQKVYSSGVVVDVIPCRVRHKDGRFIWLEFLISPVYNQQDISCFVSSGRDITERVVAEESIKTSLKLLEKSEYSKNEASKIAEIGFWDYDSVTDTLTWSDYVYRIYGLDPKDDRLSREEMLVFFDEESQEKLLNATSSLDSSGTPYDIELKLINRKKEEIWLRTIVQPIYNQQNEMVGRRGVFQNITASKKAQLELELSKQDVQTSLNLLEKKDHSIKQMSNVAKMGYWEYDSESDVFKWSEYIYHIFGFDPKDEIPSRKEMVAFYDKESQEKLANATKELNLTGIPYDDEFRLINLKNEEVWVRNVVQPIYNEQNELVGKRGVIQNITTSKKAQLELELSKQKVQSSLELLEKSEYSKNEVSKVAKIGYWEYENATDTFISSDAVYYIFGLDPTDEIPPREKIVSCYDKESQEKLGKAILELTLNGTPFDLEFKIINIRNEEVWVRNVVQPLYNQQNEIIGRRGVTQNITTSKKAQLELELSKQEIQATLEVVKENEYSLKEAGRMARIGYWRYDKQIDTISWSKAIHKIYGTDFNDDVPDIETILSVFNEESRIKLIEATVILARDGLPFDIELQMINLKNEKRWIRNIGEPIYNDKNEIVGRRGISQDITEQKLKQSELDLKSEKLYELNNALNAAQEMAHVGSWFHDISSKKSEWSDETFRIWGFDSKKPIPDEEVFLSRIHKDDRELFNAATDLVFSQGASYDIEYRICLNNGEEKTVRSICKPIFGDDGKVISLNGVNQDITQEKQKQKELDLQNEKLYELNNALNEAQELAHVGSWFYDYASDTSEWSDETFRIWGFDSKEPTPNGETIESRIHKDDVELFNRAGDLVYREGIPFDIEFRICLDNNEEKTVRSICKPIFGDDGVVSSLKGTNQDITAQKQAIDKIEKAEEMYRVLADNSNDLICLHELDSSFKYISPSIKNLLGYEQSELLGEKVFGIVHKDDIRHLIGVMKERVSNSMFTDAFSCRVLHKDGHFIWLEFLSSPVYKNKEISHFVSSARNITQKVIADQKIKSALELIEKKEYALLEVSTMAKIGYWEFDSLTNTIIWSEYLYQIFGFEPKDEVPTRKEIMAFFDKESQKKIEQATIELTSKGISYDLELKLINQKKDEIWVRNVVQPIYNKQNEIIGRRGLFQNITASKKAQIALELSRQEITSSLKLLETSEYSKNEASKVARIGFWEHDLVNETVKWSDFVHEVFGSNPKNGIPPQNVIVELLDKESQELFTEVTLALISKGIPYDIELKIINLKKEKVWIRNVAQPIYNKQNKIVGKRGVMQDITDRKKIEAEHLRIKNDFRRLFDNATVSVWSEDLTLVYKEIGKLRKRNIPNIKKYLEQHPDVLFSFLNKVKVNSVNKATLELFKAKNHQEFLGRLQDTFGEGAHKVFMGLIEAIWNNDKAFTSEVNYKTLEGDEFAALLSVSIPQTEIEQKTVPASIQSIQSLKDAELEKRESEKKLNIAEKLAGVGSWIFEVSTQKNEWSEEMFNIWNFDEKKGAPEYDTIINRIHTDDLELFNSAIDEVITNGIPYDIEFRISPPNNEIKWIRAICEPIFGDNGDVVSLSGSNQDVTSQKQAIDDIEKAEEMYRILTDNSNDLICLQEPNSTFKYISPSIINILGYEQSEYLGRQVFNIVHKDDIQRLKSAMDQKIFQSKAVDAFSFRIRHKKGHFVWLDFLSSPVYREGEISYFVTSARDVTQWVFAQQEIEEYQTSLQKMTTEMTFIEEKQKKEIASNIHDHLSQSLVISKMKINELKKNTQLKVIDEDLKFIDTHISEALENSRKITYELSPPVLYQLGLIDALNWLFEDVETTHKIVCSVHTNVSSVELSDLKSILLYISIQELIKNIVKYANASLISLDLNRNKKGINILLTDNGSGFDISELNNYKNHSGSGFGLFAVQERIRNIQGKFEITSEINVGTSVKIFIPLAIRIP